MKATASPTRLLTPRDLDVLEALDRCPLTASQLLKVSRTFVLPFTTERKVRARLQAMAGAGRVHRWPYSIAGRGGLQYYSLTRQAYRLLRGPHAGSPPKGMFSPIGIARQQHSYALAEFVVHTVVSAHYAGAALTGYCRENSLRFTDGVESIYPDSAFQLCLPILTPFGFMVEVDNGTERVCTPKDVESWERKIRVYEWLQDQLEARFRVLVIGMRSMERVQNILTAAARLASNPKRSLLLGTTLSMYLSHANAVSAPCFLDHLGRAVSLLPIVATREPVPGTSDTSQFASAALPSPSCSRVCSSV